MGAGAPLALALLVLEKDRTSCWAACLAALAQCLSPHVHCFPREVTVALCGEASDLTGHAESLREGLGVGVSVVCVSVPPFTNYNAA